jgi:broad specificity phosphatase PhoE
VFDVPTRPAAPGLDLPDTAPDEALPRFGSGTASTRHVEIRRHSLRVEGGQHLSRQGVALARQVGATMGPFNRVITSTLSRSLETAVAMGFAVDEQTEQLSRLGAEVDAEVDAEAGFAEFARAIRKGGATGLLAVSLAAMLRALALHLPPGSSGLVVTHGGIVEAAAVGCMFDADHASWGPACGYCEGVRLAFNGDRFVSADVLRVNQVVN